MVAMTVGIDLAKSVFQVHGVDSSGRQLANAIRGLLGEFAAHRDVKQQRLTLR